jgi:hypothetical protein
MKANSNPIPPNLFTNLFEDISQTQLGKETQSISGWLQTHQPEIICLNRHGSTYKLQLKILVSGENMWDSEWKSITHKS